jgi:hypothetical protein
MFRESNGQPGQEVLEIGKFSREYGHTLRNADTSDTRKSAPTTFLDPWDSLPPLRPGMDSARSHESDATCESIPKPLSPPDRTPYDATPAIFERCAV